MSGVNIILLTEGIMSATYLRTAGPYRLATEVRKYGYTCQVIDFFTFFTFDEWEKLIDKYVGNDTIVIGFSTTFLNHCVDDVIDNSSNILNELLNRQNISKKRNFTSKICGFNNINFTKLLLLFKKNNNNVKFVIGGANSNKYNTNKLFDTIYSYADQTFLEYIKKHDTKKIGKYNGEKFDFNRSQILWQPDDHIFKNESLPIETTRGCIFKCKFCNFPLNNKKKFDYIKEPEVLKEEFERNYELYGTTNYIFCDDTFNDSTYKLEKINTIINNLNFKLEISGYIRLDLINKNKEQLELLNNMGFYHFNCGIETINEKTQNYIGKIINKNDILNICYYIKNKYPNITLSFSFIFGLPFETPETLENMYQWLIKYNEDNFGVYTSPFYLISDCTIFNEKEKYGYIYKDPTNWFNTNKFDYNKCIEYSRKINSISYKNFMKPIGFINITSKNLTNKFPQNDISPIQKLEKVINLYKQKILS